MRIAAWVTSKIGKPMELCERDEHPGAGEVLVQVAGCGICHTDLSFYYEGVPTRHPLPLTLGHEISGVVVAAGAGAENLLEEAVIVPAVIPCGNCAACRSGHATICPQQVFPGNDVHGGFATHVRVPIRGLCRVPRPAEGGLPIELADLSVLADAITTPFQAIVRSGLESGDLALFVGVGGIGGFGVQIAAAFGASVVAIDLNPERLALLRAHGAQLTLEATLEPKRLKQQIREHAERLGIPTWRWKIFETSGRPAGQELAFDLVRHGSHLSVIGYSAEKIALRLSNLMAFDATARGNWGCAPDLYPQALQLVLDGKICLAPFIERRPLATINQSFEDIRAHRAMRRIILCPE